jgi:hypothetical protein
METNWTEASGFASSIRVLAKEAGGRVEERELEVITNDLNPWMLLVNGAFH